MAKRISDKMYNELTESRDWSVLNGLTGLTQFYSELLTMHARRRALPFGAAEYRIEEEADDRRRNR